ncbi:MAG: ferritin-like domain-containing protein [Desulfobacteraceae bacterium]|nr:MAG: ferritin-like domain-containing protein [Desulfobacteraceae bacterium]
MPDAKLKEILLLCLSIEKAAAEFYFAFSEQAEIDDHKAFWKDICQDENRHIAYWEELLDLEEKGRLWNPFDRPKRTKAELAAMKREIDDESSDKRGSTDTSGMTLSALRLEYMMLHPAFAILFHFLRKETNVKSPYDDYQKHIDKFMRFVHKFPKKIPEMEVIGEILSNMWQRNTDLAHKFAQIRTLRGLIPICASCKKIRDDQGYWSQIELYIRDHSEAEFTHSICPECLEKLYPKTLMKNE